MVGWPVAPGNGLGAWAYYDYPYYADPCIVWNGYAWINICYRADLRAGAALRSSDGAMRLLAFPSLGPAVQLNRKDRPRD